MYEFSLRRAWSYGLGFFAVRAPLHLLFLIVLAVLAPLALDYLASPATEPMAEPESASEAALGSMGLGSAAALVLAAAGWLLQSTGYFASWRLGFSRGAGAASAGLFGLVAALVTVAASALFVVALAMAGAAVAESVAWLAVIFAFGIIGAALFTLMAAVVAVGLALVLLVTMAIGVSTGNMGLAATIAGGGSGFVVVLLVVFCGIVLWLSARLSCTCPIMAERNSYNLFAAAAASWRLTWEEQFRIMGYLALIGLVVAVTAAAIGIAAGMSIASGILAAPASEAGLGPLVAGLVIGIPAAFLTVLVPAGIYRELAGAAAQAEVFA